MLEWAKSVNNTSVSRERLEEVVFRLFEQHMSEYLDEEADWARKLLVGICEEWDRKVRLAGCATNAHYWVCIYARDYLGEASTYCSSFLPWPASED